MDKPKSYITDEERINCRKVAEAFAEISNFEDLVIVNAGNYGFVKLQYFNFPYGFDTATAFFDSQSLFDDLWTEWLETQLINIADGTPMEEMDYQDILKCMPKEKQKEFFDKRIYFAKKSGIESILNNTIKRMAEII
ncbi:MAG: hypothetical protein HFI43_05775 [Lachnospiraceae bacterium]|jgi:hypothetical protein|nr:hypothetical protein [Lachnospiraceae bacterium]